MADLVLSGWAELVRSEDTPRRPDDNVPVRFFMLTAASPVYVHVYEESGRTVATSVMEPRGDGLWERQLDLSPGRYLYRFYIHDGRITLCCPPEGSPSGKLDAPLHVRRSDDGGACVGRRVHRRDWPLDLAHATRLST